MLTTNPSIPKRVRCPTRPVDDKRRASDGSLTRPKMACKAFSTLLSFRFQRGSLLERHFIDLLFLPARANGGDVDDLNPAAGFGLQRELILAPNGALDELLRILELFV